MIVCGFVVSRIQVDPSFSGKFSLTNISKCYHRLTRNTSIETRDGNTANGAANGILTHCQLITLMDTVIYGL